MIEDSTSNDVFSQHSGHALGLSFYSTTEQAHPNGCAGKATHNTHAATSEYAYGPRLVRSYERPVRDGPSSTGIVETSLTWRQY